MPDLPRSHLVAYAIAAVLVVVFGVRQLRQDHPQQQQAATPVAAVRLDRGASASGGRIVVHVAGAVRRAGVYRLAAGARVDDAVRRAGGARRRADLTQVNLAAKLEDGRQVLIPERTPTGASGAATSSAASPTAPLNLNTATLEQLDTLDGVGPSTAQKILDYREERGGFGSVEELGQIPGIGERRLASLREQVRV